MYPVGPISHERHHFVFSLEIEQSLQAEVEAQDEIESENLCSRGTVDAVGEEDEEDDDSDEIFLSSAPSKLPTASEICARSSYSNSDTKNIKSSINAVTNLIKATINQPRRQTDETVGLDDDDEGFCDDEEEILRQIYRHDSLVQRMSSSFNRRLSDCMRNLALETSQRDGLSSAAQNHKHDEHDDDDDSIEYVDYQKNDDNYHKVGECFEMDVIVDHQAATGITTVPTSNTNNNKSSPRRRKSATSTDAISDALLRVLGGSSSSGGCKLSDDDLVPAEVQIGDAARRMGRRYSTGRSSPRAYAA